MPSLPCCMCTIVVCGLLDLASLFCVTEPAACRHTCCSPPDLTHACCVWAPPALQEHSRFVYDEQLTWRKLGHLLLIPTNVMVIFQVRAESYRSVNLGPSRKPAATPDSKNCHICAPAQPGMGCPAARPLSLHPPPPCGTLCAGPVWVPALGHDPHIPQRLPVTEQGAVGAGRHHGAPPLQGTTPRCCVCMPCLSLLSS